MKSVSQQISWLGFFLIATLFTGLTFRWQMAGFGWESWFSLDWRRAHSHLGFYGVLFPIAWLCLQSLGHWAPRKHLVPAYGWMVAVAGVAFLLQGYGLYSIVASTGVLLVWLIFAWKNPPVFKLSQRDWITPASYAVYISAILIPVVAVLSKRDPVLSNQVARTFLSVLLFGIFVPSALRSLKAPPPRAYLWLLTTVISALFLTGLLTQPLWGLGLVGLAGLILKSLYHAHFAAPDRESKDWRLTGLWAFFAFSLALTGSGLMPYTYNQAIAGVHFLVLGPLLMTFALAHLKLKPHFLLRLLYEAGLAVMVSSIALPALSGAHLHFVAAASGTAILVSVLLLFLSRLFLRTA